KALRLLDRAGRRAERLDVPVLGFEIARVRARALDALGSPAEARRHARAALHLAVECGWEYRMRAVRAEFGLGETMYPARVGGIGGRLAGPGFRPAQDPLSETVSTQVYRRRLDALQQVSLAASTVLDPRELARVALQETISILGAERAFL